MSNQVLVFLLFKLLSPRPLYYSHGKLLKVMQMLSSLPLSVKSSYSYKLITTINKQIRFMQFNLRKRLNLVLLNNLNSMTKKFQMI